jgi:hypothetical protein
MPQRVMYHQPVTEIRAGDQVTINTLRKGKVLRVENIGTDGARRIYFEDNGDVGVNLRPDIDHSIVSLDVTITREVQPDKPFPVGTVASMGRTDRNDRLRFRTATAWVDDKGRHQYNAAGGDEQVRRGMYTLIFNPDSVNPPSY